MTRMRLVGWEVRPIVMADDGDYLVPVPVDPMTIPSARWDEFKAGKDEEALAGVRAEIEGPGEPGAERVSPSAPSAFDHSAVRSDSAAAAPPLGPTIEHIPDAMPN